MNILEHKLFKTNYTVFDDKFDVDNLHHYQLNLFVDNVGLSVFVHNSTNKKALLLEKYSFRNASQPADILQVLEAVFVHHSYINAGFWKKIVVIFKTQNFTFLPNSVFESQKKEAYLEFCTDYNKQAELVFSNKNTELGFHSVFSVNKQLCQFFQNKYPKGIEVLSHIDTFVKTLMQEGHHKKQNELFICAQDQKLSLVKFKNETLEYANIFDFKSSEDLTYFTMLVINELGLNPDIMNLTIWGNLDTNSLYFKRLGEYVKNLSLGKRPSSLDFSYHFDDVSESESYDLLGYRNS